MKKPSSGWYVGPDQAPIARPWTFDYDADYVGDPMTPVTTQASISGPQGELIVEEPGPEATWVELEHIVKCVNAHEELVKALRRLTTACEAVRSLDDAARLNGAYAEAIDAIRLAEGGGS